MLRNVLQERLSQNAPQEVQHELLATVLKIKKFITGTIVSILSLFPFALYCAFVTREQILFW
jgi:hypothetical protein